MTVPERGGVDRRTYLRLAVAAGGLAAASACLEERAGDVPPGTDDFSSLPERQHAWNEFLETDADGNVRPPEHHVLLALSLETEPDDDARERVEESLRTLERAYERSNEGLAFTVGYAPAYFDRFDDLLPASVDVPEPEALSDREDPSFDDFDALVHLASDHPDVVLSAEEALFGELGELNGEPMDADLDGIFERLDDRRRTGFVGAGLPAEHTDVNGVPDAIPEDAPFLMGFRSGFRESQASEDRVTIPAGPFAGGTTQHVSSMDLQLETWFEQENHHQRVAKLFSPHHADEGLVGDVGEELGASNALREEWIESTAADARERGVVGHAQKAARAREDGEPILLRRDFNTVDGDRPGVHFLSLQREVADFVRVREAMTAADLAGEGGVGTTLNNGILQYLFVRRRGNFLVPPRSRRALPTPNPG